MDVMAYVAPSAGARLERSSITRREPGPRDVAIDIAYAGICHSDIHQAREEWGGSLFPMVPGHEITGIVTAVGADVTRFAPGDRVGVGVFVDSCRTCEACARGLESYCLNGPSPTYNGYEQDGVTPTYGGYSTHIVTDEHFVVAVPEALGLDVAAPLLCAGITTYSPLRHWNVGPGSRVAVMGLGGLGHMGLKFAAAMGAEVTLISHSPSKETDARRLGAHDFLLSSDRDAMRGSRNRFDFILNTVSANLELHRYLALLRLDGTLCNVGLPTEPLSVPTFALTGARRSIAGSNVGGCAEVQEMLDFAAEHGLGSDIEIIDAADVNEAWERVVISDVRYRFVIDAGTI